MATAKTDTGAGQQADHAVNAKDQAGNNGYDDGKQGGKDHFFLCAAGAKIDAGLIFRFCGAFHQTGNLAELTAHLNNDALGGAANGGHGERREKERLTWLSDE
jgi:hypothetical protein